MAPARGKRHAERAASKERVAHASESLPCSVAVSRHPLPWKAHGPRRQPEPCLNRTALSCAKRRAFTGQRAIQLGRRPLTDAEGYLSGSIGSTRRREESKIERCDLEEATFSSCLERSRLPRAPRTVARPAAAPPAARPRTRLAPPARRRASRPPLAPPHRPLGPRAHRLRRAPEAGFHRRIHSTQIAIGS